MKLENNLQANKTIQNLKFNNETKLVRGSCEKTTDPSSSTSRPQVPLLLNPWGPRQFTSWVVLYSVSRR